MNVYLFYDEMKKFDMEKTISACESFPLNFASAFHASGMKVTVVEKFSHEKDLTQIPFVMTDMDKLSEYIDMTEKNIFVFCGYHPHKIAMITKLAKRYNAKAVSYIFDTHLIATKNYVFPIRILTNLYYSYGIHQLRHLDGVILYTNKAAQYLHIKIPFIISRLGIPVTDLPMRKTEQHEKKRILFAGSLQEHDGINEILQAMQFLGPNIYLEIYGQGELENIVKEATKKNDHIRYGGVISRAELQKKYQDADLLLNVRDIKNDVVKVSFPTKFLEYLSSGTPVLTTKFTDGVDFQKISFIIEDIRPQALAQAITEALYSDRADLKISEAAKYLKEYHNWGRIMDEIQTFFEGLYGENDDIQQA